MLAGFFVALLSGHIYILIICKLPLALACQAQNGPVSNANIDNKSCVPARFDSTDLRHHA